MDPDELRELLGLDYTGSFARLVQICEDFNRAAEEMALAAVQARIEKHERECPAHQLFPLLREPELGSEEWRRLHTS